MAILCPPLFRDDLSFLGMTFSAKTANSMWFGGISFVLTSMAVCSVIQIVYKLLGWGFQKRLDPLGFGIYISFTIGLYDNVETLLFSH